MQPATKNRIQGVVSGIAIYFGLVFLLSVWLHIYLGLTIASSAPAVTITPLQSFLDDWGFTVVFILACVLTFLIKRGLKKKPTKKVLFVILSTLVLIPIALTLCGFLVMYTHKYGFSHVSEKERHQRLEQARIDGYMTALGVFQGSAPLTVIAGLDSLCKEGNQTACQQLEQKATQASAAEQDNIGRLYHAGNQMPPVQRDDAAALKWFRVAADRNDANAQYNLGMMYAGGFGVERDYKIAYMWLTLASAQGNKEAQSAIGTIQQSLTPEQKTEVQKMVQEWRPVTSSQPSH